MNDESTFTLRLHGPGKDGQGVRPQSVDIKDIADFLNHWRKAIVETAEYHKLALPANGESPVLSLMEVADKSCGLRLLPKAGAMLAMSIISQALATDDYTDLPPKALVPLEAVSRQAAQKGWAVEIKSENASITTTEISAEHPVVMPEEMVLRGTTTLIGRLQRVGGVKPKAEIKTDFGDLHFIEISEEMAKVLAPLLYEIVSLDGQAVFDSTTLEIIEFRAEKLNEFRSKDLVEAFEELSRRVDGAWDDVDVLEFFRLERGDED